MSSSQGIVVLLHGISRTSRSMKRLEASLIASGYVVRNIDYPSVTYSIETLSELVVQKIKADMQSAAPLHFVGHSMGGILIRLIVRHHHPKNLSRVVMLGTPNHGSAVVDLFKRFRFFKKWFGPAGQQIGTTYENLPHHLPPVDYECGVIAGSRSTDPWFSWFLFQGQNDGKVSVDNTKVEGMKDFVIVPVSHAAMPKNKKVIQFVKNFLSAGHF